MRESPGWARPLCPVRALSAWSIGLVLAGCEGVSFAPGVPPDDDWPLRVRLSGAPRAFEATELDVAGGTCALGTGESIAAEGELAANAFAIDATDEYVRVRLAEGERWVRYAAPIDGRARRFLRAMLASEAPDVGCPSLTVFPFADPDRAIVVGPRSIAAVRFSDQRLRMLDTGRAMLESCRMDPGRRVYRCSLDLSWSEARFDADGVELSGSFRPSWAP